MKIKNNTKIVLTGEEANILEELLKKLDAWLFKKDKEHGFDESNLPLWKYIGLDNEKHLYFIENIIGGFLEK